MHDSGKATYISIAWPETLVIKEGKWYDHPMTWIGVIKNNYYKVGHAAMIIIEHDTGEAHYFDFGRYHTPIKHGRVRNKISDPHLAVREKAAFSSDGSVLNLPEILKEVAANRNTHGDGRMLASVYTGLRFDLLWEKAITIQNRDAVPYGPFVIGGSMCSRFVAQVARAADVSTFTGLLLALPYTVSPTPVSNIRVISNHPFYYEVNEGRVTEKRQLFGKMWSRKIEEQQESSVEIAY